MVILLESPLHSYKSSYSHDIARSIALKIIYIIGAMWFHAIGKGFLFKTV